eukprot:5455253-Heterocapsa_arctica.AAC.1
MDSDTLLAHFMNAREVPTGPTVPALSSVQERAPKLPPLIAKAEPMSPPKRQEHIATFLRSEEELEH